MSAVDAVARWEVVKLGDERDGMLGWMGAWCDEDLGDLGLVGEVEKRARR